MKGIGRRVGEGKERREVQSIISTSYRRGNSGKKRWSKVKQLAYDLLASWSQEPEVKFRCFWPKSHASSILSWQEALFLLMRKMTSPPGEGKVGDHSPIHGKDSCSGPPNSRDRTEFRKAGSGCWPPGSEASSSVWICSVTLAHDRKK